MANSIGGAVWAVDTPQAATLQSGVTYVSKVRWVGGSTAGHQAIVTDVGGRVVYAGVSTGANFTDQTEFSDGTLFGAMPISNLTVATLQSGTLYIEIAR